MLKKYLLANRRKVSVCVIHTDIEIGTNTRDNAKKDEPLMKIIN